VDSVTTAPRITVVVPARDAAATLTPLVAALRSQESPPGGMEVLIVDNGSRDATAQIARDAGFTVLEHKDVPGASAARNAGARAASGDLIAFVDADCVPSPGWAVALASAFDDPGVGGVGGRVIAATPTTVLEQYAEREGYITQDAGLSDPYLPWVLTANCCFRREVLEQLGGFDEEMVGAEDVHFSRRMQREIGLRVGYAPDAVVEHRHRSSVRGLWRQWVRAGWGTTQLRARYPDARAVSPKGAAPHVWIARRAARLARALVGLPFGRSERVDVAAPFLDVLVRVGERVGRRQARRATDHARSAAMRR
jgi:cellulose synthase/poly-beta-1,6-N-acetylglucosamine synthase-like glycosyltransferase